MEAQKGEKLVLLRISREALSDTARRSACRLQLARTPHAGWCRKFARGRAAVESPRFSGGLLQPKAIPSACQDRLFAMALAMQNTAARSELQRMQSIRPCADHFIMGSMGARKNGTDRPVILRNPISPRKVDEVLMMAQHSRLG
eukprot:1430519-Rhodomonas_salina.1